MCNDMEQCGASKLAGMVVNTYESGKRIGAFAEMSCNEEIVIWICAQLLEKKLITLRKENR